MVTILTHISAFFSWFIDYTIDISIFICIIFIIKTIISRRLPAWWHYGLWLVLLVRMLFPWKYVRTSQLPELIPLPLPNIHILDSMILGKNMMVLDIAKGASVNIHGLSISFDKALLYTWLAGAVLLGLYTLFRNLRFWIRIKQKPMLIEREILDLLEECKTRMKINTIVGITVTDLVESPALFGYLRPRLLLPEGVPEKLTREELAYVFMHELGHLKRHDIGISWIITFLQVFHWFNPFVWLAFYQMRIDQESACDASVLSKIMHNQSKDYANSIVGFLEKFCQNSQLPAMAGIIENKSQMKRRIAMIVKYRKSSKKITIGAIVMLLFTGFVFYTLTGFAQDKQANSNETELSSDAQKAMVTAQEFIQKNDFSSARKPLLDYIAANPGQIPKDIYLMLGYCWYGDHKIEEALQVFEEGYESYPDNFDLMSYYAATLYETGYYTEAAPMMEKLYEKDVKKQTRYLEAAWGAYYQVKNYEDAIRVLKKMISVSDAPKSQWYTMIFQIYYNDIKDQEKAEEILNEAIEKFPEEKNFFQSLNKGGKGDTVISGFYRPPEEKSKGSQPESRNNTGNNPDSLYVTSFNLNEVNQPPRVIRAVNPGYPAEAIQKGLEGKVKIRFIVDSEGHVKEPEVVESVHEGVFDEAALEAVKKYLFKPAVKDGKNVDCIVKVPIVFSIPKEQVEE